jgi:FAD/FMN-containing dehydrogenase
VTKLAVQLWPQPAHRRRLFVLAYDRSEALGLLRRLARHPLFDDLGGVSWVLGKMMFGVMNPAEWDPDEPEFYLYLDQSAETEAELRVKRERLEGLLSQARRDGVALEAPLDIADLIQANPAFARFGDFPMTLDFLLDYPGGGLTWVGTYGPLAQWEEGARRGAEILEPHGFPPAIVVRAMRGGHFGVLRFILVFDKANPEEMVRVRAANAAVCDAVLDLGFIPYKTPGWAVQRMLDRLDPGFLALLRSLKALLDPNGIMNPGKWLLGNV